MKRVNHTLKTCNDFKEPKNGQFEFFVGIKFLSKAIDVWGELKDKMVKSAKSQERTQCGKSVSRDRPLIVFTIIILGMVTNDYHHLHFTKVLCQPWFLDSWHIPGCPSWRRLPWPSGVEDGARHRVCDHQHQRWTQMLNFVIISYFYNCSTDQALLMSGSVSGSTRAQWQTSRTQSSWMELARSWWNIWWRIFIETVDNTDDWSRWPSESLPSTALAFFSTPHSPFSPTRLWTTSELSLFTGKRPALHARQCDVNNQTFINAQVSEGLHSRALQPAHLRRGPCVDHCDWGLCRARLP